LKSAVYFTWRGHTTTNNSSHCKNAKAVLFRVSEVFNKLNWPVLKHLKPLLRRAPIAHFYLLLTQAIHSLPTGQVNQTSMRNCTAGPKPSDSGTVFITLCWIRLRIRPAVQTARASCVKIVPVQQLPFTFLDAVRVTDPDVLAAVGVWLHQPVGFGVQSKYLAVKGGTRSAEVVLDEVSAEIDAHLPYVVEGTGCLGETELIPSSAVFCQFESIWIQNQQNPAIKTIRKIRKEFFFTWFN